ncbi:MAG: hypothetical protein JOY62_08665 [Acidobacteriaceae bacterium]|nr:hypothetical protein [Acidobacteriaceae bacterium]MBV9780033.1 hypothetical protein [Acidobacteriaceae bacterium]
MLARRLRIVHRMIGAAVFAALAIPPAFLAQEDEEHEHHRFPHYRVIDLGTLKGDTSSQGLGLGRRGQVGGISINSHGIVRAFLWTRHTGMRYLGTLGGPNSGAGPVNEGDEVAVVSEIAKIDPYAENFCLFFTNHECLGAIWENGLLKPLSTLGGHNAQAYDLNDEGQVVGFSETETKEKKGSCLSPSQRFDFKGVIWQPNGEIQELEPLPGDTVSFAFGINNKGQTVGASGLCSNTSVPPNPSAPHAVLWDSDGTPHDLGSFRGAMVNVANDINNRGDVAGDSQSHAFLWTKETGKLRDLGSLPGAVATVLPCCNTLNDRREIVGFSIDASGNFTAFYWKDGSIVDLNRLISKGSPWSLQAALSLNNAGEITGYGTIHGETHAFLAIPCHHHGDRECCDQDEE